MFLRAPANNRKARLRSKLFESAKPDIENIKNISVVDQTKNPTALFKRDEMIRLAEKTAYAVGTDEYRPAMTGVLFQLIQIVGQFRCIEFRADGRMQKY